MPLSNQTREMKATEILAIRLGLEPEDILWEGTPDIKQKFHAVVWYYKEIQRDANGSTLFDWHENLKTKSRSIVVPPELHQEWANHMVNGVPGE